MIERANACLGSPFQLRGPVAHGDKRGRTLGYPTANLVPDPALVCPAHGVYACRAAVELDGEWRWWPAATSVGVRPTFVTGRGLLVEAFLLGFDGDLYGRELRLAFLQRLRGELRFDSVDELVAQMAPRRRGDAPDRGLTRRGRSRSAASLRVRAGTCRLCASCSPMARRHRAGA